VINARSDFADHDQRKGSEEIWSRRDHVLFSAPLRTGLLLREFSSVFPACWNVSPTSTVRTTWRAGPGCGGEPKAMTGVAIVIPMLNEAAGLPRLLRSLAALAESQAKSMRERVAREV
jgi:hypothetical protein